MAEFAGRCRICLTKNTGHKIQAPQDLLFMRPQTCRTAVAYDRTGLWPYGCQNLEGVLNFSTAVVSSGGWQRVHNMYLYVAMHKFKSK